MLQFERDIAPIEGWLTIKEAAQLYEHAKNARRTIVEIGSWKGRSTVCLARGSLAGQCVPVFAVDHHKGSSEHRRKGSSIDTFPAFLATIRQAEAETIVRPLCMTSAAATLTVQEEIDLLFIDGSHECSAVRDDYRHWFPKVADGGWIAIHDTVGWLGPQLWTAWLLLTAHDIRYPRLAGSITSMQKTRRATFRERRENACFLLRRTFFGT